MTIELLSLLQHSTLLLSLALLGVLFLRGPWLRCFGARNVMLLWLSVPATLLALFLPAPVRRIEGGAFSTLAAEGAASLPATPAALSEPVITISDGGLLVVWVIGAVLMTALLALRQWHYLRSMGRLNARPDGSFHSQSTNMSPALVGALRPRIVVPADFDQRYTPEQQSLILAHERCHLRRGDAQLTLLACLLRSLFWFNPLVHLAWSRFRIDQELACDASVLRVHPASRREYAETMLSTQFFPAQLVVGCTWLTGNPLRRRITMLYTHTPGKFKLLAGTILALSASTAAAIGAWNSQEPQLRYLPTIAPLPAIVTESAPSVAPAPILSRLAAEPFAPGPAAVATIPGPDRYAERAPQLAAVASTTPETAPSPAPVGYATQDQTSSKAPEADSQSASKANEAPHVQAPRLIKASRPSFPRTFNKPELVSYPGMPEAEQPGPDWEPEGSIWQIELRVALDENGKIVEAAIADNNLSSGGLVRRYERLALRAVRDWQYEPARIGGEPVASEVLLAFHFDTQIGRLHDIGNPPYAVNRPISSRVRYTRK